MGIPGFFKLIEGTEIKLSTLRGKTIAIDASTELYRAALGGTSLSHNGKSTAHINVITCLLGKYRKANINCIYVFDNKKSPALKAAELQKRKERRDKATDTKTAFRLTDEIVQDIQNVLTLYGVPYMIAPPQYDAEHVCACLNRDGTVDAVVTTDADTFLYGATSILKFEKRKLMRYDIANLKIGENSATHEQILKIGVILGCDFCAKTPRIGPKTVLSKLDTQLTAEQNAAIAQFRSVCDVPDTITGQSDLNALLDWLVDRGFNRDRMSKLLS